VSTGAIVAIIIGALIVLALLALLLSRGRRRRLDTKRHDAREIRREAEVGRAQADRTRAEADERAARARREEAGAREQSAVAEAKQREARDRHMEAAKLDPDVDEKEAAERYDRGEVIGDRSGAGGDASVEHHERTETAGEERERHYVRDEDGNVVRDEDVREPRTER